MTDSPHSKFLHLYVITRFDIPVDPNRPMTDTALVKAFSSEDEANREALRLNDLNEAKGTRYEVFVTRLIK